MKRSKREQTSRQIDVIVRVEVVGGSYSDARKAARDSVKIDALHGVDVVTKFTRLTNSERK